jgi:mannose-1-phosphate guanylyltransferase
MKAENARTNDRNAPARSAVILAGGDGTRLRTLTRMIAGDDRPKQFCRIVGGETLLDVTRRRAALKIASENIFYSLTARHERYYRPLVAGVSPDRLCVQPENKGTAPAIIHSLHRVIRANPESTVAFFPSDHYFSDDAAFMERVETAFRTVESDPGSIVLLGIEPDSAETSYGWIEPCDSLFGDVANSVTRVRRFWEKPDHATATDLLRRGCLWNSFVMVGKASFLLELIRDRLPELSRIFHGASVTIGSRHETATMRALYAWIVETNFSTEVLQRSPQHLFVLRVGDVAWSDWGEPERVIGTLNGLGVRPEWMLAQAA